MPPASKKNASIILFDVKTKSDFAAEAKRCLLNICASKWFSDSNDCTKLILLNSKETNNTIFNNHGKAMHIFEATDVISYNPLLVKRHIEGVETGEGDWLLGLITAIDALKVYFLEIQNVITKQVLLISDFSTPANLKEKRIDFVIRNLNNLSIYLYVLGPKVKVPNFMASFEDVRNWSKNIEFIDNENANLLTVKRIVENIKGVVCDLDLGQELFKCYIQHKSLQPWVVPLTAGTCFNVFTSSSRFLRAKAPPKLFSEGPRGAWTWHHANDLLAEVDESNVIGGVFRHGKFIPFHADIEKTFKCEGRRSFKIMMFTDRKNVKEFYIQGDGAYYVQSNNSKCFATLLAVLAEQNKCIIAKKVYMQNAKPKLVALLPELKHGVFIQVDLAYADDLKANFCETEVKTEPIEDSPVVNAMYEYLQKLDITDPDNRDENGSVKFPMAANLLDSVQLNCIARRCLNKYLGEEINTEFDIKLPSMVEDVAKYKEFVPLQTAEVKEKIIKKVQN